MSYKDTLRTHHIDLIHQIEDEIVHVAHFLYGKNIFTDDKLDEILRTSISKFKRTGDLLRSINREGLPAYKELYHACVQYQLHEAADILKQHIDLSEQSSDNSRNQDDACSGTPGAPRSQVLGTGHTVRMKAMSKDMKAMREEVEALRREQTEDQELITELDGELQTQETSVAMINGNIRKLKDHVAELEIENAQLKTEQQRQAMEIEIIRGRQKLCHLEANKDEVTPKDLAQLEETCRSLPRNPSAQLLRLDIFTFLTKVVFLWLRKDDETEVDDRRTIVGFQAEGTMESGTDMPFWKIHVNRGQHLEVKSHNCPQFTAPVSGCYVLLNRFFEWGAQIKLFNRKDVKGDSQPDVLYPRDADERCTYGIYAFVDMKAGEKMTALVTTSEAKFQWSLLLIEEH